MLAQPSTAQKYLSGEKPQKRKQTCALRHERNHIAQNEQFGQPLCSDQSQVLGLKEANETAQDHVDGRSKERGPKKKRQALDRVGGRRPVRSFCCG